MTLDKFETDLLKEAKRHKVSSMEKAKPIFGERLIGICRGLAQKALAYPYDQQTIDQAWNDEDFINRNYSLIDSYTSYIHNDFNLNTRTDSLTNHFAEVIATKEAEIIDIKTTRLTSEQITDKDRFKIKPTIGGMLKL